MQAEIDIETLTGAIIGCEMEVHRILGPGFLESVYEKALVIELELHGFTCVRQTPIQATYKGHPVGDFVSDLLVEKRVLVELKASQTLHDRHGIQLVNYLTATGIDNGLLLNFGTDSLQFKRKRRLYTPHPHPSCQSCNPG
jgi:GxxExxY protein